MTQKFQYSPGLPGYGTRGTDGSTGLTGVATWFSSYDGGSDTVTIKGKIIANKELFSNDELIPGYPTRTYQNGDIIIDRNARIYQIDFGETNFYKDTGIFLNTSGFFTAGPVQADSPNFERYSNQYETEKYLIDSVYSNDAGDYTQYPDSIYDIGADYFGRIDFVDQDLSPDFIVQGSNYIPFNVWTTGVSNENDSIALVRDIDTNNWRFGNLDGGSLRDVSLSLDFKDVMMTNDLYVGNDLTVENNITLNDGNIVFGTSNKGIKQSNDTGFTWIAGGSNASPNNGGYVVVVGKSEGGIDAGNVIINPANSAGMKVKIDSTLEIGDGDVSIGGDLYLNSSIPTGTPLYGTAGSEGLFIDTGSSNQLKRYSIPVSTFTNGSNNRIVTATSTTGLTAETNLEFSTDTLTCTNDVASFEIKKEDRVWGDNTFSNLGIKTSRGANGSGADAAGGGWLSLFCNRGGDITSGSHNGGDSGVFQLNGTTTSYLRGGDVYSGTGGLGSVIFIYGTDGGWVNGDGGTGGDGGYIHIVGGDGGKINGVGLAGYAGDGGNIDIVAGDGGDGNTAGYSGNGGRVLIKSGSGPLTGAAPGSSGKVQIDSDDRLEVNADTYIDGDVDITGDIDIDGTTTTKGGRVERIFFPVTTSGITLSLDDPIVSWYGLSSADVFLPTSPALGQKITFYNINRDTNRIARIRPQSTHEIFWNGGIITTSDAGAAINYRRGGIFVYANIDTWVGQLI